jgi:AcrR family transcriptional regulator
MATNESAPRPTSRATRTANGSTPGRGGRPRDPAVEEAILQATRRRLIRDGYSTMTIADIVADAGVTRPTLYRRWSNKYDLVVDALNYGLQAQRASYPPVDWDALEPIEAFTEALRRLDPCYANRGAMALHGNFMAEAERVPELLQQLREHAVRPRCDELRDTILRLQERGAVRADVDVDTVVTLCFGSYFAEYLRVGEGTSGLVDRVVAFVWPSIAVPKDA